MGMIPRKVGLTITDTIVLISDSTYTGITGQPQSNWTIQVVSGTTDISNAGITITEIDSVLRPGQYSLAISGATGFAASAGTYTVLCYLTAQPQYSFVETYYVSADGTFSGAVGSASFTASAGNGRITNGSTGLQYATVRVTNSSGVLYGQFTSDVNGLWGPLYFDAAGTYQIAVQLAGYTTSTTLAITVSGGVATGPGVDIALSLVASVTGLQQADLLAYARRMARNASGTQSDTELLQAVNDALDMVAMEKQWSFLLTTAVLSVNGAINSTGITVTQGSATVQVTDQALPSWVNNANGYVKLKYNGQILPVVGATSGTLTLSQPFADVSASAQAGVIMQDEYPLAPSCLNLVRILPGQNWGYGGQAVGYAQIVELLNEAQYAQKFPNCWAIKGNHLMVLYPYPLQAINIPYVYYAKPAWLVSSADVAMWDPNLVGLLRRAIDVQVALRYRDCVAGSIEQCERVYDRALDLAKSNDGTTSNRDTNLLNPLTLRRRRYLTSPNNG